jgi:transcriptional/translational regulatory protein YebC/TACO1
MFSRKGVILVDRDAAPQEDALLETVLEAGAEDLRDAESQWEIVTEATAFKAVQNALAQAGVRVSSAELTMVPQATVRVDGAQARQVLALMDALEENEDVQAVHANFDIPEEVLAEAG